MWAYMILIAQINYLELVNLFCLCFEVEIFEEYGFVNSVFIYSALDVEWWFAWGSLF